MTKNKILIFYILYFLIGILITIFITVTTQKKQKAEPEIKPSTSNYIDCDHVRWANAPISPTNKLNDLNEAHLLHAQKNGLTQFFETNDDFNARIDDYTKTSTLVKVTENKFYQLKTLSHSYPYLIPEAVDMLNEIGYRFQKQLKEKKYKNFSFRISSLLRSVETQTKLSHKNFNATAHSAHLYGTTVDISYKNFYNNDTDSIESSWEGIQALTKVLVDMRMECKLLVVRERKQACFHITVVACKPHEEKKKI